MKSVNRNYGVISESIESIEVRGDEVTFVRNTVGGSLALENIFEQAGIIPNHMERLPDHRLLVEIARKEAGKAIAEIMTIRNNNSPAQRRWLTQAAKELGIDLPGIQR